ncbi:22.0 kDa heat shock protein [Acorus calamus]|uniref:22.0 kDa heat shock protein n=1 Tax=Acorus calamus TaxID=4465 RepID=A0AAV9DGR3_ACOCL|nr:22.0 kDa heat shock protein [Acorus calamus]
MIHNKKPPPKTPPKTQTNQKKKAMNQNNKNQPKSRTFIPSKRKPPTELIKIVKANMDFQLGLKFKTRPNRDIEDELTFFSTETDDSFYLVLSNLSGFKTDELDIKISDDGKTITVRGGRVFDDVVAAAGDLTVRREMRIGRFKKEFRIPDGVDLDRIDADLDEDHGILYVYLPKAAAMAAVAKEVHGVLPEIGAEKSYPVADRLEEAEAEAIAPDSNQRRRSRRRRRRRLSRRIRIRRRRSRRRRRRPRWIRNARRSGRRRRIGIGRARDPRRSMRGRGIWIVRWRTEGNLEEMRWLRRRKGKGLGR